MGTNLLAQARDPARCKEVGKDTRLRMRRLRPGDILFTGRGEFAIKEGGLDRGNPFHRAAVFVDKATVLEPVFGGVVVSRLKVLDFEWEFSRTCRSASSLLGMPTSAVAAVYRNGAFLSGLRKRVLGEVCSGGQGIANILSFGSIEDELELRMDAKASSMITSAAEPFLFKEYSFMARLLSDFAKALRADGVGKLQKFLLALAARDDVGEVISRLESFLGFAGSNDAGGRAAGGPRVSPAGQVPQNLGVSCSEFVCGLYSSMGFPLPVSSGAIPLGALAQCQDLSYVEGVISQGRSSFRISMEQASALVREADFADDPGTQALSMEVAYADELNAGSLPGIPGHQACNLRELEEVAIENQATLNGVVEVLRGACRASAPSHEREPDSRPRAYQTLPRHAGLEKPLQSLD